jgi:hypothetical protein
VFVNVFGYLNRYCDQNRMPCPFARTYNIAQCYYTHISNHRDDHRCEILYLHIHTGSKVINTNALALLEHYMFMTCTFMYIM